MYGAWQNAARTEGDLRLYKNLAFELALSQFRHQMMSPNSIRDFFVDPDMEIRDGIDFMCQLP